MVVRELLTRLSFSVNETQLKKYEQGTRNIQSAAENAANSFRNMFAAFLGFQSVKSLINVADSMQSLEARIGLLPQTTESAAKSFDLIVQKANESRQSIEAYGTLYIRLADATKTYLTTQEDVLSVTTAISNALVVGGAKTQEQASAMLQLSQAFQKGKLDGDEFRSFMENMSSNVKDLLAQQLGASSVGELFKMSSDGKLLAKDLAKAFIEIGPKIQAQILKMPLNVGQAVTIVGNKISAFINRLNRESMIITKIANFILDSFEYVADKLDSFVERIGGATQALKLFGIVAAAALTPLLVKGFVGALMLLISPIGLLIAGLSLFYIAIEDVYVWMKGGDSVIGAFINKVKNLSSGIKLILIPALALFNTWLAFLVIKSLVAATASAMPFFVMIAGWVSAAAVAVVKAAVIAASWLVAIAPIVLIIAAVAAVVYALYWLWNNWDKVLTWMKDIASKSWDFIVGKFNDSINWIKDKWNGLKDFFGIGVNANLSASPNQMVTPQQTASAAVSAGGAGSRVQTNNVTINQSLPAGSPPEVQAAARAGTQQALNDGRLGELTRQMGVMAP